MSNVSNNFGENVLVDQKYDGFAPFVLDGRDQSRYMYYRTGIFCSVQADEYAIVMNKLNPSRRDIRLLEPGFHKINPVFEKFIYVPNPYGPSVIDFKPLNDQDKKENFIFTPGMLIKSGDMDDTSQDEIYIDYKVEVKLIDPIRYLNSSRVIQNLKFTIVSILREYVARSRKEDLFSGFSRLDINHLDPRGKLKAFEYKFGLRVDSLGVNNIKLSEAVQKAKNESAVSKENIKKAKYEREAAIIRAESDRAGFEKILEMAEEKGFNASQKIELLRFYTQGQFAKNPNAHVFIGSGNSMMDPAMMLAMYGGSRFGDSNNSKVIDAQYSEEFDKAPMLGNNNGKKRKR